MNFADKLSALRIILIPVFISLLIYSRDYFYLKYVAVGVFITAILSDFFDGLVARIKREKSEFGQIIDPLADKLLLLSAFLCLYALKFKIPLGVVLVVVSRDLIILLGVVILNFLKIGIVMAPTFTGKLTTFFQMFTILAILLDIIFAPVIWGIAVIFTLVSGIEYFLRGIKAVNDSINSA